MSNEKKNDGGLVHPTMDTWWKSREDGAYYAGHSEGMTLRDHFAGLAMQGLIANRVLTTRSVEGVEYLVANQAYAIADAMLKAREQ